MFEVPGYRVDERIYEGRKSVVYRGVRHQEGRRVVLKLLRSDYPSPRELARHRHEFRINRMLWEQGIRGIVEAIALEPVENSLVIVFEDAGSGTLKELVSYRRLELVTVLDIFARVAETISEVHAAGVIHKDIKPHNIIVDRDSLEVRLTDFGVASQLDREQQQFVAPNRLEGTLAYMAPEQTGRMNRPIDARSDLYAIGASLYEVLTMRRPFEATDPMELVHCHIAKEPTPPREVVTSLPEQVSEIVLKLLTKTAQDRYQSAQGLAVDLRRCVEDLRERGTVERFALAEHDVPERFVLPERLYGRGREIAQVLRAFDRVSEGRSLVLAVAGYSGIGKTALVSEVKRPITTRRGYFLAGKVDQNQRSQPYAPLILAFAELVRQVLSESEESVQAWRNRLRDGLGDGLSVLVELIPELELLVGQQSASAVLASAESQNRFLEVFADFLAVVATPQHPVALFLDDMQWADSPSLKLIERMATRSGVENLLFILAYRDNEVGDAHPLAIALDDIHQQGGEVDRIALRGLDVEDLTELVADTLYCSTRVARPLAELAGHKTGGNPFFFGEFLRALHREGLIRRDRERGWVWEIDALAGRDFASNVIDLMAERLHQHDSRLQRALAVAAVFGARFELAGVASLLGTSEGELADRLAEGVREQLLVPFDDDWKLALDLDGDGQLDDEVEPRYRFVHDRVQQSAYEMLGDEEREALHLQVGRQLLGDHSFEAIEDQIFDIVAHFSEARRLLETTEERYRVAKLSHVAGRRSMRAAAWEPAIQYFESGIELLREQLWSDSEGLSLGLHMGLSECLYLVGRHEEAERLFDVILERAASDLERAAVYHLRMVLYGNITRYVEAIECGRKALAACGINFDTDVKQLDVLLAVLRVKWLMRGRTVESLEFLPELSDPRLLVAVRILNSMAAPAYFLDANLYIALVVRMLQLSIQHGNSNVSSYSYALYGMISGSVLGDFAAGMRFGELAIRIERRYANPDVVAKVHMIVGNFVNPWRNPVRTDLEYLKHGYKEGRAAGDLIYAGYCAVCIVYAMLAQGESLDALYRESHRYLEFLRQTGDEDSAATFVIEQRMVLALQGHTESPTSFGDEAFDETRFIESIEQRKMKIPFYLFCLLKMRVHALCDEPAEVLRWADMARPHEAVSFGMPWGPEFDLYQGLAAVRQIESGAPGRGRHRKLVRKSVGRLKKWSDNSPSNYLQKYELLRAEVTRAQGKSDKALHHFELAIATARRNGFLHDEALACQLAAAHHRALGHGRMGRGLVQDARYAYLRWGATALVARLDHLYPELRLAAELPINPLSTLSTQGETSSSATGALDLISVMKASQAISSEIVLDKLLRLLVEILLENAGARRGILLLQREQGLRIEAEGAANLPSHSFEVLQSQVLEEEHLATTVVQFVARTLQSVVLRDASDPYDAIASRFGHDPYIAQARPRSILVAPILHMKDLVGVLYLENNLNAGVFTNDRLELIHMLSSQIAIAIENAELYRRQEEMARSLARFVPREFLEVLGRPSILEVRLGDAVEREMTVLFSDIRSFTALSERLSPERNFRFLNAYLSRVGPVVRQHDGFVDKYIGDAIMALFPHRVDDALHAAISLQRQVEQFNAEQTDPELPELRIGVGLHFGHLMLGTIGEAERMEGTVIADAVNIAARLEELTKHYGVRVLASGQTIDRSENSTRPVRHRWLGRIVLRGRREAVDIHEVLEAEALDQIEQRLADAPAIRSAVEAMMRGEAATAIDGFRAVLARNPDDEPVRRLLEQAELAASVARPVRAVTMTSPGF
ncbi:MAG: hypothetical protein RIT45_1820 [Pseudomonadota bacterium]|jgi:predicted ATPase/class 3 adenylate cyclase/tRNA A-37 threonylcarbamoyl transferase component Bud32